MDTVAELMSTTVVTIPAGTSLVEAAQVMVMRDKGALPIVQDDRVVGIITDRDILAEAVARCRDVTALTVDDIATPGVVTIEPSASLEDARQEMARRQLDRLVVIDHDDRIVGIISKTDLQQWALPTD